MADVLGTEKLLALREHAGHMRVTLKTVLFYQSEDFFHLPRVVHIFGKHIFVERVAGRAMHEQKTVLAAAARQFAQKIPPLGILRRRAPRLFQLLARPENGPFSARIE